MKKLITNLRHISIIIATHYIENKNKIFRLFVFLQITLYLIASLTSLSYVIIFIPYILLFGYMIMIDIVGRFLKLTHEKYGTNKQE